MCIELFAYMRARLSTMTFNLLPFTFCLSFTLYLSFLFCAPVQAKTLILEGKIDSRISVTQQITFSLDKPVSTLEFKFALPASFSNRAVHQDIQKINWSFSPGPVSVSDESDAYGNHFKKVLWNNLNNDAHVTITFETRLKSELSAMESSIAFPVKALAPEEAVYLRSTDLVQSGSAQIIAATKRVTAGAATEYGAVTAILNYVSD